MFLRPDSTLHLSLWLDLLVMIPHLEHGKGTIILCQWSQHWGIGAQCHLLLHLLLRTALTGVQCLVREKGKEGKKQTSGSQYHLCIQNSERSETATGWQRPYEQELLCALRKQNRKGKIQQEGTGSSKTRAQLRQPMEVLPRTQNRAEEKTWKGKWELYSKMIGIHLPLPSSQSTFKRGAEETT